MCTCNLKLHPMLDCTSYSKLNGCLRNESKPNINDTIYMSIDAIKTCRMFFLYRHDVIHNFLFISMSRSNFDQLPTQVGG